jgi:hypothetical protein
MKILKTQEKMRSEVHKWCTILRKYGSPLPLLSSARLSS